MTFPNDYSDEDLVTIYEAPYEAPAKTEPFETELRNRLHDILEEWESVANYQDPITAALILGMSDQISDAMYPPEDANA